MLQFYDHLKQVGLNSERRGDHEGYYQTTPELLNHIQKIAYRVLFKV